MLCEVERQVGVILEAKLEVKLLRWRGGFGAVVRVVFGREKGNGVVFIIRVWAGLWNGPRSGVGWWMFVFGLDLWFWVLIFRIRLVI